MFGTQKSHPSYGLLKFIRTNGGNQNLFGSSIKHSEKISLQIKPAKIERDLSNDWYFSNGPSIVEAEMSYSQFAEAITSMNMGEGIPITLTRVNGEAIERDEFDNKRRQFEEEFKASMQNLETKLSSLTQQAEDILTNKKSINKGDKETILKQINSLKQEIRSNIPYVQAQFNIQMDKTVQEAKGEIEAWSMRKVNELGLESLQQLATLKEVDKKTKNELD